MAHKFYRRVDLRSRSSMTEFLRGHFRYNTLNHWNRSTSYANNIKIYSRNDDQIMVEKNMIAIENKKNIFAYGNSAYEMYEKAPANIQISHPLSNGVIADINNMERLVKFFITN